MNAHAQAQKPPALEWAMGAIGAVLFITILALIVWNRDQTAPPSISVRIVSVERIQSGYALSFEARNDGDLTAAEVKIVAQLETGATTQRRSALLDYIPPQSTRRGGLFFTSDPRQGALDIAAHGYRDP